MPRPQNPLTIQRLLKMLSLKLMMQLPNLPHFLRYRLQNRLLSLNLKWFVEFVVQRNERRENVMTMQIGLNGWYNSQWYAPAWNPAVGVFHNQASVLYENGPIVDAFMNIQWKRACIFVKLENANMGWPLKDSDYFTAHNFINTQRTLKVGIFWPFYLQPGRGFKAGGGTGEGGSMGSSSGSRSSVRRGGGNFRQSVN